MWACEIDAIDAIASPRKPIEVMWYRSSSSMILLVACGVRASARSSGPMPRPLSLTRMSLRPPSSTTTSITVAPASRAFSSSSLTTLAGRSITSPAAILFTRCRGSTLMLGMNDYSVGARIKMEQF